MKNFGDSNTCLESQEGEEQFELLFTIKFGWEGVEIYPNEWIFVHIS